MSWKTFKFFDYEEVKDPETNEPLNKLKVKVNLTKIRVIPYSQDLGITCCSCGRGMMIFGGKLT